jgi:MFS family permease
LGVLRALRWPAYRRVWLTATLMQFGYWFSSISFQWLVARETDNDPLSLSILYFSMLVPMTVFSLPAGVLADVRDRRRVLLLAQLGILTLSTVTATLVFLDRAPFQVLLACGFAGGLVHVLAIPSSQALAANAVPTEDLRSGVLIQAAGMNLARIVGPAVAGVLILAWGAVESLVTYGAIAVLTLVALRGLRNIPGNAAPVARQGLAARIWSGREPCPSAPAGRYRAGHRGRDLGVRAVVLRPAAGPGGPGVAGPVDLPDARHHRGRRLGGRRAGGGTAAGRPADGHPRPR